jgi:hypothetical protein
MLDMRGVCWSCEWETHLIWILEATRRPRAHGEEGEPLYHESTIRGGVLSLLTLTRSSSSIVNFDEESSDRSNEHVSPGGPAIAKQRL